MRLRSFNLKLNFHLTIHMHKTVAQPSGLPMNSIQYFLFFSLLRYPVIPLKIFFAVACIPSLLLIISYAFSLACHTVDIDNCM